MHVERTFTVPRPVDAVFDYLSDFTSTNDWDPGTVETRRTAGDGGLGTTYRNISEFMGRRTELQYETVAHERPTTVQFRGRNKQATTRDTLTFAPSASGSGTTVHYRADFDFGTLGNLVAPLLLRRKLEKLADEVQAEMERVIPEKVDA
jgi:carbon monoxide dehydrogenase subunit G